MRVDLPEQCLGFRKSGVEGEGLLSCPLAVQERLGTREAKDHRHLDNHPDGAECAGELPIARDRLLKQFYGVKRMLGAIRLGYGNVIEVP